VTGTFHTVFTNIPLPFPYLDSKLTVRSKSSNSVLLTYYYKKVPVMLRWRKIRRNYTNTNGRIVQADNNIALRIHLTGWWFAFKVCGLGLVSEAWSFEKAARASGKFGGVAGVFAGVTSWKEEWKRLEFKVINEINMKILLWTCTQSTLTALCWLWEGIAASWKNKLKAV